MASKNDDPAQNKEYRQTIRELEGELQILSLREKEFQQAL